MLENSEKERRVEGEGVEKRAEERKEVWKVAYIVEPVVLWTGAVDGDSEGAAEAAEAGAKAVEHFCAFAGQRVLQKYDLVDLTR